MPAVIALSQNSFYRCVAAAARQLMTKHRCIGLIPVFVLAVIAGAAAAEVEVRYYTSDDTLLRLGPYAFEGGKTLDLTVGIGSGAFRHPDDPANVVWTVSDRGPNIACDEMKAVAGVEPAACKDVRGGRIYPLPTYAPSIYRVILLNDGTFRVTDVITLKDRDGRPLNGLPNPLHTATTDTPLDGRGQLLPQDVHGIDVEGVVRLADGTFWTSDENGPSLMHFTADGRLLVRHVPRGTEGEYSGARYEVKGTLPAILAKRQGNRGIESIAISPDERFLYFILQNPLANPDAAAYRAARNTRLFKIERASMKVVGEYVYTLDDPRSFRRDPSDKQNDPRISEMMAVGLDRLIVLERTEQTTKLHEIALAGARNISGTAWDDMATKPTLEQSDLAAAKITPVGKTLRFDSADFPRIVGKTEGMALLGDGALLLINDDDFGITGARTQIVVVRGTGIAAPNQAARRD
jgi:hypothetical protein